ncbi:MAG: hypothetical protein JW904_02915 [Spirochaetales bacterium]|nr:hypothetical protein [Spirochaetales bacterium]
MRQFIFVATCIFLLLTFFSCSVAIGNHTVTLWTNKEEIISFVEEYNNSQVKYKVQVFFRESPIEDLLHSEITPDLIFAENLDTPLALSKIEPLSLLFYKDAIKPEQLYPDLRNMFARPDARTVIPFSFNLPVIIYKKDSIPESADTAIDINALRTISVQFNKKSGSTVQSIGFSPLWNTDFLISGSMLFGCNFHADSSGKMLYQEDALKSYIDYIQAWISESAFGYKAERYFTDRYLYDAAYNLVDSPDNSPSRTGFAFMLSNDLIRIPAPKDKKINFRWLSKDSIIPVNDRILYFGVIKNAVNRTGAYDFLKWAFDADVQIRVMTLNKQRKTGYFGTAGGLSTIPRVNAVAFTQLYPQLDSHLPNPASLVFPPPLPANWQTLKRDVIFPWIVDMASGKEWIPIPYDPGA